MGVWAGACTFGPPGKRDMKPVPITEYMLFFLVAAIWGLSFSLIKVGVAEIGPATLTAGRITIAAMVLTAWLVFVKRIKLNMSIESLSCYAIIGLFGNALPFTLIGWSELTLDSSLVAVLMGIMPLFTVVMAHFFLDDEPFTMKTLTGISAGFSGVLVLLGFSVWKGVNHEALAQLTVLVATLCYAGVTIFVRLHVKASGLEVATGALIAGAVFSIMAAFMFESPFEMGWNMRAIVPMTLLGLFPTALASVLYFRLVRNMGATRFAQINYIIPVFGGIAGIGFLDEQAHWRMVVALGLILLGIYLVHGARRGIPRVL